MPKIKLICWQSTSKQSPRVHVPWPGQSSASQCSPICRLGRLDTNFIKAITAMTVRQILENDEGKEFDVSLSIKQLTLYSYKKEHKIQVVFGKKHLLKNKSKLRKLNSKLLPPACSSQYE